MLHACCPQLGWKRLVQGLISIPSVRTAQTPSSEQQANRECSSSHSCFRKGFCWFELCQLHLPGCFCSQHQLPKYPASMHHMEMSEGLLFFDRVGILKSVELVIPNDMDTVESVTSGDIKPFLLVWAACIHGHFLNGFHIHLGFVNYCCVLKQMHFELAILKCFSLCSTLCVNTLKSLRISAWGMLWICLEHCFCECV